MSYHDDDHADTARERFGDPQQQGFSERYMRPQPCTMPEQIKPNGPETAKTLKEIFCENQN